MTALEEAARRTLSAAMAGDLEALAAGLADRAEAIAQGGVATPEMVAMGQESIELLQTLIRSGGSDLARLGQMQSGYAAGLNMPPNIDQVG